MTGSAVGRRGSPSIDHSQSVLEPRPRRTAAIGPWANRIVGHRDVPPERLIPHPDNWRLHPPGQRKALRALIGTVGLVDSVLVNVQTGHVLNGHLRVELALERGEATIPVEYVDLDEAEERQVLLAFDPLSELATVDPHRLEALMTGAGVDNDALRSMLAALAVRNSVPLPGIVDPDTIPPLPATTPYVEAGDLWILGGVHRLVVGDATDPAAVERATDGARAEVLWTDPPFGMRYEGKARRRVKIVNGDPVTSEAAVAGALRLAPLEPAARFYIVTPTGARLLSILRIVEELGWTLHQELIWLKRRITPGHADYQNGFERILYGYSGGPGRPGRGRHPDSRWHGGNAESSVLEFRRAGANGAYPTAKPVGLVERCLRNSSEPGDLVFEPFAGTGTTILAAEATGRRCAAIEIDARHAQVAIERYQAATGKPTVRA